MCAFHIFTLLLVAISHCYDMDVCSDAGLRRNRKLHVLAEHRDKNSNLKCKNKTLCDKNKMKYHFHTATFNNFLCFNSFVRKTW